MKNQIKILIAEDQELVRKSLEIILKNQADIEVLGSVKNGREAIGFVRKTKPDIILMDIRMPVMDGVTCTKIIKEHYPEIKIIILTTFDDDEYIFAALRDGASGYLLKGISADELVCAIRKVNQGNSMLNEDITAKVIHLFSNMAKNNLYIEVDKLGIESIVPNELKIIRLVSRGLSNKEIAAKLNFSEGTVRNYLSSILAKLNLRDRTQLAIWALQTGAQVLQSKESEDI